MASEMLAFQRQRAVNMGESSMAWISVSSTVLLLRKRATLASSKLCVSPSDSTMASSVAAACSSKLNVRQNFLRSARPKARLTRAPNGAWMMSCMPPDSSKKRSNTSVSSVGSLPSTALAPRQVFHQLLRGRVAAGDSALRRVSMARAMARAVTSGSSASMSARRRETDADSSSVRAGASPSQNGMRRRLALGVFDAHAAGFHAQDAIRGVAELEDVAREALDGEVLVERADEDAGRLEDHLVVGVVGNGAAAGDGREPRALARAQHLVDRVAVQIGAAPAALGADAVGEHAHHGVEILALEIAIRIRAAHQREQLVLAVFARGDFGDDLLREHVERMLGNVQRGRARRAARHRAARRNRPARRGCAGKMRPFGHAAHRVVGAADALQEYRDAARRAELAHQLDVADVDAELERGGGHHDLELAGLEALLGVEAGFLARASRGARRRAVSPSRSARWRETRSTMRRVLAKISVVWCSSMSCASWS